MPSGHFRSYLDHYFAPHPSQQVRELFVSRAILDFAVGMVMLFEPIYLRSIGFSVPAILAFYGVLYVLYFLLLPLGGRICRRHGYEHTILFSSPFLVIWYLAFFAIPLHWAFIPVAIIALAIQKILYWPGYHANFATWSQKGQDGREVSTMTAVAGLAAVAAPAFGGIVIATLGYETLFIFVSALILLSNVPLLRTPELYMPQGFGYMTAMRRLARPEHRKRFLAFFGYGEELLVLVAWPIFLALVIPDTPSIGAIVSLAMLVNVVATLYVGRASDNGNRQAVIRSGVVYVVASWLLRPLVTGGLGAFLMDSFSRVAKNMVAVPMTASMYGEARDGAVMDSVVFFEMALALGKAAAAFLCAIILAVSPAAWTAVFLVAAGFAGLYAFMPSARAAAARS